LALTRRLANALGLRPGERVADVASGPGRTAFLLTAEFGVNVDGIDLGEATVAAANAKAVDAGVDDQVAFQVGDAERLPLPDESVDAVVCECALCTFPDKAAAADEMARVLKPGGRVGITDVTLDPDRLDPELASLAGCRLAGQHSVMGVVVGKFGGRERHARSDEDRWLGLPER
jgi:ubiquinone/menaquinone biosynthesis C-methylase UbiE